MFESVVKRYFSRELDTRTKELGLKRWYIAYYCEISEGCLVECLRGERLPTVWQLILMAEMCNCTVNDLLGYRYFRGDTDKIASSIPQAKRRLAENMWNRINDLLFDRHMDYHRLSERIGISSMTVDSWFKTGSSTYPKTIVFLRICDALDCTPSELLGY